MFFYLKIYFYEENYYFVQTLDCLDIRYIVDKIRKNEIVPLQNLYVF